MKEKGYYQRFIDQEHDTSIVKPGVQSTAEAVDRFLFDYQFEKRWKTLANQKLGGEIYKIGDK